VLAVPAAVAALDLDSGRHRPGSTIDSNNVEQARADRSAVPPRIDGEV
jgi:hypothetical protein